MQVLKEKVRQKILSAAEMVFYKKDYRSATVADIAGKAGVPVALIYTYFNSKAVLFDAVVNSVYVNFSTALDKEERAHGSAVSRFEAAGEKYIHELLKNHRAVVILMDKSSGTKHAGAKQTVVRQLQRHIEHGLRRRVAASYDPKLAHILANNCAALPE